MRRPNKNDQKILRTYSISPPNLSPKPTNDLNLKRSKSNKEITSKSGQVQRSKSTSKKDHHEASKSLSTTSIIPFINQCIQPERTPTRHKPPLVPPKRPPPPIPKKQPLMQGTNTMESHIYDSCQDNSSLGNDCRSTYSYAKTNSVEHSTVPKSHLPPMRVTDL